MTFLKTRFYAVLLASLAACGILTANAAGKFQTQYFVSPRPGVTVLHGTENVLGKTLICAGDERAGRIVDVLADPDGNVRAAIVDFGGFLGVGSRKIAVDWSDLKFEGSRISIGLTRERLSRAPEVREGRPVLAISARASRDRADASHLIGPP
jgi:PRC-barrel domain